MGIESTLPNWAIDELENIVDKYSKVEFTREHLNELREELILVGLADYIPETIAKVVEEN